MDKLKKILWSPNEESQDFKCGVCDKFLSVSPIWHSNSVGNICGRCDIDKLPAETNVNEAVERQTLFENTARHLEFPCSYNMKGCNAELVWEKVADHESTCTFRNIVCPLSFVEFLDEDEEECIWKGEDNQLIPHIQQEHKKYFNSTSQFCLSPEIKSKLIFFEMPDGHVVIIIFDYHKISYKYNFHIFADLPLYECNQYTCELKMFDDDQKSSIVMQKDNIKPLTGGFVGEIKNGSCLEIDIHSIRELLKKRVVTILFNIRKKNVPLPSPEMCGSSNNDVPLNTSELMVEELDEDWIKNLKCDNCATFSLPPIYSCPASHNYCCKCYNAKPEYCGFCAQNNLVENSFIFELFTRGLNYPCENKDKGCTFKGPLLKLQLHQEICPLTHRQCLMSACPWTGSDESLSNHSQEAHGFLEVNRIHKLKLNSVAQYMLHFESQLFYFTVSYKPNESFAFNVFCIGKEMVEYKYDLVIIGSSIMGIKISLSHVCQPSLSRKIPDKFTGISIPFNCLEQFISNVNELLFKINISKIKK